MKTISIGDISVEFPTWQELSDQIEDFISQNKATHQIVTLNSLMFNMSLRDQELKTCIKNASRVLPDSAGIIFAGYMLTAGKCGILRRLPGIDIMLNICALAQQKGYRVFLLGARPDVIPGAALNLRNMFPKLQLAGYHHGYFDKQEEENILNNIKAAKPDILFVGLDIPYQEKWIGRNLNRFGTARVAMGVGGSFDVISGELARAPSWMQTVGLEWFFRLIQQPRRVKRMKDLPVFTLKVMKKAIVGKW